MFTLNSYKKGIQFTEIRKCPVTYVLNSIENFPEFCVGPYLDRKLTRTIVQCYEHGTSNYAIIGTFRVRKFIHKKIVNNRIYLHLLRYPPIDIVECFFLLIARIPLPEKTKFFRDFHKLYESNTKTSELRRKFRECVKSPVIDQKYLESLYTYQAYERS